MVNLFVAGINEIGMNNYIPLQKKYVTFRHKAKYYNLPRDAEV